MSIITPDQSRQARRELGLSQADVAEATGLKRQYLSEFESETAQRFTTAQLRKLRTFYEGKIEEARTAGEEIDLTFGQVAPANQNPPAARLETVTAKRFTFQVADEVPNDAIAATLATIGANDKRLAGLLSSFAEREEAIFGAGEFTEETLEAFREAHALLAANYLLIRTLGGWPEIGLKAGNIDASADTILAGIINHSMRDTFARLGLIANVEQEEGSEA